MSFAKFSDENFDAVDWINDAFKSVAPGEHEKFAMSLLSKIQISMQELNKSIEDTTHEAVVALPRISREVEAMSQEAMVLQKQMCSVQHDVHKVEQDTVAAMDTLLKLDEEKSSLSAEVNVLREVENWTSLTSDIEEVFGSGDADQMAERLRALNACLNALNEKVADYKSKRDYLDQLTDQFVAVISPSVLTAFSSQNIDNVQYFSEIFEDLERGQQFRQYYAKCLKIDLGQKWSELKASPDHGGASELYSAWNAVVLKCLSSQLKWCARAFSESTAPTMACAALAQCLHQLNDQVASTLRDQLCETQEQCAALNHMKLDTDAFVQKFQETLPAADGFNVGENAQNLLNDDSNRAENLKRLDASVAPIFTEANRMLELGQVFMGNVVVMPLIKALQTYFSNFVSKYRKCAQALATAVQSATSASTIPENEGADSVTQSQTVAENWDLVDQALKMVHVNGRILNEYNRLQQDLLAVFSRLSHEKHAETHTHRRRTSTMSSNSLFEQLLLDDQSMSANVTEFVIRYSDEHGNATRFLSDFEKNIVKLTNRTNRATIEIILGPITSLLETLPKLNVWESAHVGESLEANLPSFSFIPQEYVTKIGQYVMTLAHHLEPYLSSEDRSMNLALQRCPLPYLESDAVDDMSEPAARQWLRACVLGLMSRYVEMCLRIRRLSTPGAKQLAVDIDYLSNVAEDLGLAASHDLQSLHALLQMSTSQLKSAHGYSPTMLAAVRQMRSK